MRSFVLSNGSLLVTLDACGEVRDLYFPHVGLENHAGGGLRHRIGIYVDGALSWLSEDSRWKIRVESVADSLETRIDAVNDPLQLALSFKDIVYNESDIFLREVTVVNHSERARKIKLFFGQELTISQSPGGDTAYFDPETGTIVHYKDQRAFLINGRAGDDTPFDEYSVGLFDTAGKEGTFRDAEDGALAKNPIEHGRVDSVIGVTLPLEPGAHRVVRYWLAAGDSIKRAFELNAYVLRKTDRQSVA